MPRPSAQRLLGPLEYEVMRSLWASAPASVSQVQESLNETRADEDGLAYTTVMTVLARLTDKELLDRTKVGRGYEYSPRYDEAALVEHLGGLAVAELVDRYGEVALAKFAAALEDADPALLRRLVELQGGDDA